MKYDSYQEEIICLAFIQSWLEIQFFQNIYEMDLELKAATFMFSNIRKYCISLKSITAYFLSEIETKCFGGKTWKKQTTWKIMA